MNPRERFKSLLPDSVYLDLHHQDELAELLYKNSWIRPDDKVLAMAKPGEGNMNFVVRVKTNSTSIIVKQSRPWVEKYPQIDAPASRIFVEAEFYNVLMHDSYYNGLCPSIIGFDANNFLLVLEDLGEGTDCTFIYEPDSTFEDAELFSLIDFVSHLHNTP